ncbi:hypothetical protein HHK36_005968 [Tetracentron sinense]|uniref:Uncharacterized protein n=1 Tax=Tetracentron sinense TaxID=13715 RepID=A0A835DNN6_TETSI|nr:hypothetical protein HHK36_005968 [Tetracentron sinense]
MRLLNLIDSERQTEGIMERKLHEAAMKGSVTSLLELLQEDPLLLDRIIAACIADTPLHIAVMLGHIDFAKQVLSRRPELASESDSKGSSPLHLASAKGYEELVKELLLIDSEICLSRDQNGRTPLQIATIKGRVTILSELIRVKPESTRVLTDRGETILHLCVKHNRLASLQLLVGSIQEDELLNWKDHDGNTILHLAVARKQIEAIQFLLTTTRVEVNVLNANGSTALDVLQQSSRDLRDTEIKESLRGAGALRARDMHFVSRDYVPTEVPQIAKPLVSQKSILKPQVLLQRKSPPRIHAIYMVFWKYLENQEEWLKKAECSKVVASLITTIAFQDVVNPRGCARQDDTPLDPKLTMGTIGVVAEVIMWTEIPSVGLTSV